MKKILFILSTVMLLNIKLGAQTTTPTPAGVEPETAKQQDFDKKFRFGIRVTPQPTWYKSSNNNSKGNGSVVGFGFGLIMEFKLSDIIQFSTGIGGDFEGGYVKYRYDLDFTTNVAVDNENNLVEAKDGLSKDQYELVNGTSQYILNERRYKTTFVTIPLLLKMRTQEYGGMRYFMVFGGELGIRAGLRGKDTYVSGLKTSVNGGAVTTATLTEADLSRDDIDLGKDGSMIPMRVGLNVGFGTEYRIAGSTSLLFSINYFQSFTNLMRSDSKFLTKGSENSYEPSTGYNFSPFNQSLTQRAIRINIGLLF